MKTVLSVVVTSGLVALAGCNVFDPDQSVILGVPKIDAPATVAAGSPFTVGVTVQTGGCRSFDRIDVQKFDAGVRLVPWGKDASAGRKDISCPAYILEELHSVQIDPPFSDPYQVVVEQGRLAPVVATIDIQ
jgi:hypothetical protein